MKKSQILAALALAFALGVVVPVAGASAVDQGDTTLTTDSQKAAEAAVKEVKQSFDTITVYDENGVIKSVYTGAAAYGFINDNAATLSNALDFVADGEKAYNATKNEGDITKAFQEKVATYTYTDSSLMTELSGITEIADLFNSADDWTGADLATAKATVAQMITLINNAANEETNQTTKDNLQKISHNLQAVITNAEIQKLVDDAVKNGTFTALETLYENLTNQDAGTIDTEAKLNAITAAVKSEFGASNWSKYLRVHDLIDAIENGLKAGATNASDVMLDRWVAQLKGADNASGDTTVTPADPDTSIKPGNTGLVGSAEGTATTVSIVAGLATALTALGAGVVVYRNARREK